MSQLSDAPLAQPLPMEELVTRMRTILLLAGLLGSACADPTRARIRMVEAEFVLPAELPSGVGHLVVFPMVRNANAPVGTTDVEQFGAHSFAVAHTTGRDTPVRVRVPLRLQPGWDANLSVLTCLDGVSQGAASVWPLTEQLLDGSLSIRVGVSDPPVACGPPVTAR